MVCLSYYCKNEWNRIIVLLPRSRLEGKSPGSRRGRRVRQPYRTEYHDTTRPRHTSSFNYSHHKRSFPVIEPSVTLWGLTTISCGYSSGAFDHMWIVHPSPGVSIIAWYGCVEPSQCKSKTWRMELGPCKTSIFDFAARFSVSLDPNIISRLRKCTIGLRTRINITVCAYQNHTRPIQNVLQYK